MYRMHPRQLAETPHEPIGVGDTFPNSQLNGVGRPLDQVLEIGLLLILAGLNLLHWRTGHSRYQSVRS